MTWNEWKYNRLKRKIEKDKDLMVFINGRIKNNSRKLKELEKEDIVILHG